MYDCSYKQAKIIFEKYFKDTDVSTLLNDLFDRSIIGNVNAITGHIKFVYRISKKEATNYQLNEKECIKVHSGVKVYLERR